ncbi:MAG: hypothetical protein FWD79_06670 [Desulfobulbus sp.]|nr:hypothetical protein [Desulfobulbus sp.]
MLSTEELDKGMVMLKTVWSALAGSLVMYVIAIPFFLRDSAITVAAATYEELRMLLYIAAGLTLAASWLVRRLLLTVRTSPTKSSRSRQHPVIQRYTTTMIVVLAMTEAIAIYGLILFLLGKNQTDLLLFSALAAAAMIFYFPRKTELIDLEKKVTSLCN